MKNLSKNNALTLIELLAASMITVIMMIAIASMDISLRNLFNRQTQSGAVMTRLSIAMSHIAHNVSKAVGDQTGLSGWGEGIAADPNAGTIHIQLENSSQTPQAYTDNNWVIYEYVGAPTHEIRYCSTNSISGSCGTVLKTFSNMTGFQPTLVEDNTAPARAYSVSVSITGRYDASQGISQTNPEATLTSAISLPNSGHTIPSP